jgi:hypothetical protein
MSGTRANASAIQRRTNPSSSQFQQQPQQQQQQQQQVRGGQRPGTGISRSGQNQQYQQQSQSQYQQQSNSTAKKHATPKISVSDAIALTTLRLGRVETFINSLPPLDQIGNVSLSNNPGFASTTIPENMRLIDEALFTSIVSRLEKLEKMDLVNNAQKQVNQKFQGSLNVLSKSFDTIKKELGDIKKTQEELKALSDLLSSSSSLIDSNESNTTDILLEPIQETEQEQEQEQTQDQVQEQDQIQEQVQEPNHLHEEAKGGLVLPLDSSNRVNIELDIAESNPQTTTQFEPVVKLAFNNGKKGGKKN